MMRVTSSDASGASGSHGVPIHDEVQGRDNTPEVDADIAKKASAGQPRIGCVSLRIASLVSLVAQNCAAVLLMRATQTRKNAVPYSTASVIASTEFTKVIACLLHIARGGEDKPIRESMNEIVSLEALKMLVPAALYTFQNKLLFVALANLEATLFQVTYQLKLLITALFMVLMLGKELTTTKWAALGILFGGIVLTQLKAQANSRRVVTSEELMTGLVAVVLSATSSAFASVYFEKVVKNTSASLAVRNVQLGVFSSIVALAGYFYGERRSATMDEYFRGYDWLVMVLVANQAVGGLLVAVVIKYADNILKGFATAVAIIVSGMLSYAFLDFVPSAVFILGAVMVIFAVGLYARDG